MKYFLRRERSTPGKISKQKARFVVYGNEEHNLDDTFSRNRFQDG